MDKQNPVQMMTDHKEEATRVKAQKEEKQPTVQHVANLTTMHPNAE